MADEVTDDSISVVGLVNSLLRHRRLIVSTMGLVFAAVAVLTLLWPRSYTAEASFTPQSSQDQARGLAGVAAQLGIAVPSGPAGESPQFYGDLITSREILGAAADSSYTVTDGRGTRSVSLADLLKIVQARPPQRRELTIRALRRRTAVLTDAETGVVTVQVTTPWPEVSGRIVGHLLDLVNAFNLNSRQTAARAERQFVEGRLEQARAELRGVEGRMQAFLQRNRDFRNSPELQFEQDRLQRDLGVRQQVVLSLTQSFEQARIAEIRNTPLLTVIEPPQVPAIPDRRRLVLKALLALIAGGMIGGLLALGRDFFSRSRASEPDEFAELVALRRAAMDDVRWVGAMVVVPVRALRMRRLHRGGGSH